MGAEAQCHGLHFLRGADEQIRMNVSTDGQELLPEVIEVQTVSAWQTEQLEVVDLFVSGVQSMTVQTDDWVVQRPLTRGAFFRNSDIL